MDKNRSESPATLQYSNPDGGDSVAGTDLAAAVVYLPVVDADANSTWEYAGGFEYHRNTAPAKQQDATLITMTASGRSGDPTGADQDHAILPTFALTWKEDRELNATSVMESARLSFLSKKLRIGVVDRLGPIGVKLDPGLGMEHEDLVKAANTSEEGSVIRGVGWIDVCLYPLFGVETEDATLAERFEIRVSYRGWEDLTETDYPDTGGDHHEMFQAGLSHYFDRDRHFGIGLAYVNGENPTESKPDQEFVQLTLLVKF